MKFLKSLLTLILILSLALGGIIGLCAINPEAADLIATTLGIQAPGDNGLDALTGNRSNLQNNADSTGDFVNGTNTGTNDIQNNGSISSSVDNQNNLNNNQSGILSPNSIPTDINGTGIGDLPDKQYEQGEDEDPVLRIPEKVSEKNGYQDIVGQTNSIGDLEARELMDTLGPGNTGSELVFDKRLYPYFDMLDEIGQTLYKQIYANAFDANKKFAPVISVGEKQLKNTFIAVYNDHPELFWLDSGYMGKVDGTGRVAEIDLKFNDLANDLNNARARFEDMAKLYLIEASGSDFDRECTIHDMLVNNLEYNLRAPYNQSAYSALVNKQTVCAGYARAMQYLLQRMDIPCYYCTGYAGEPHAWNIIGLDDGYYNVDATWADTDPENYDYFNKSDNDYFDTHRRNELSVYLPPCNGTKYSDIKVSPEDYGLRSIDDLGLSTDKIAYDLYSYNRMCTEAIVDRGLGQYSFINAIAGDELYNMVDQMYKDGSYRSQYLEDAMRKAGATNCRMSMEIEQLRDNIYYITHKINIS